MSIGPLPNVSGNLTAPEDSRNLGFNLSDDSGGASEDSSASSASPATPSAQ